MADETKRRGAPVLVVLVVALSLMAAPEAMARKAPVLVLPPVVDELPLYPAEVEQVRQAVEGWLGSKGHRVDRKLGAEVAAMAAAGRLHRDGPVCALAPSGGDIADALSGREALAVASIRLGYGCTVTGGDSNPHCSWADSIVVSLQGVPPKGNKRGTTREWRQVVDSPHEVASWLRSVERLRDYKRSLMGLLMAGPGWLRKPGIETLERHVFGGPREPRRFSGGGSGIGLDLGDALEDAFRPPDKAREAARERARKAREAAANVEEERDAVEARELAACLRKDVRIEVWALMTLSAEGAVEACHPWPAHATSPRREDIEVGACICKVTSKRPYSSGPPGRRVMARVGNQPADPPHTVERDDGKQGPNVKVKRKEPKDLVGFRAPAPVQRALQQCAPEGARPVTIEAVWDMAPDGRGQRAAVRVSGPGAAEAKACVERVIGPIEASCTPDGRRHELLIEFELERGRIW